MKKNLPKLSIITPSFNQAEFLERTILSILNQNYPNLEYIIVDGGSTDGSLEIIKKYSNLLSWWVSEKDNGQANAINKGLRRATGTWVGWQNSDDIYYKNTFYDLASVVAKNQDNVGLVIADMMLIDKTDSEIRDLQFVKPTYSSMLAEGMVLCNQSAFWRRDVHKKIGFLTEKYQYSFDFEWFLRVLKHTKATHVGRIWGALRQHKNAKSYKYSKKFKNEMDLILIGHKIFFLSPYFFKMRRLFLLLIKGQISYVFRGILRVMSFNKKLL
jgi:glycosyltransferase involved in cell wall biosynthesis